MHAVTDGDPLMRALAAAADTDDHATAAGISVDVDLWRSPAGEVHTDSYLHAADREDAVDVATARRLGCHYRDVEVSDGRVRCLVTGRFAIQDYVEDAIRRDPRLKLPDDHQLAFERIEPTDDGRPYWRTYYIARASALAADAIAEARPTIDPNTERAAVVLRLRPEAAKAFAELTRATTGKKLALVLDDRVVNAPIVNAPITGGQISLQLAGRGDQADARQLAIVLASGPLPGPVVLETQFALRHGAIVVPPEDR
jgi:hypothetical protein